MHIIAYLALSGGSLAEPRLLYRNDARLFPTSHTVQKGRSVATFDFANSTIVVEVDVRNRKESQRKLEGRGWIYVQNGKGATMARLPNFRFEPPEQAPASPYLQDVFSLDDAFVTIFSNALVASKDGAFLWSTPGDFRYATVGESFGGRGFFVLHGERKRMGLHRYGTDGKELGEPVRLSSEIEAVGYPAPSLVAVDERTAVTCLRFTPEYYEANPKVTLGLAGETNEEAAKHPGFISSVVRLDVASGSFKELLRVGMPSTWHAEMTRRVLAVKNDTVYAWLLGQLFEIPAK